jgi:hypothetical protein
MLQYLEVSISPGRRSGLQVNSEIRLLFTVIAILQSSLLASSKPPLNGTPI